MCGIAGILDLRGAPPARRLVERMNEAQVHRGPDGGGVLELGPLVLGHRRLAILDLSARGAQPMRLDGPDLAITYNGEVYNYLELREELEAAGVAFRSDTDTEVVLRAYERWGEAAFERFNGMWALALWDGRTRRLVLARDRFGIKPLYLYEDGGRLLFASEVKALLVAAPEARAVDEGVLGRFLLAGVQDDGTRTFFAGVRQLAPGAVLSLDADGGGRRERRIWSFDPERARAAFAYDDPPGELRALLDDAVRLRLRSDVPVGTCLSGGLDSSSIVALASRHSPHPVRTFTAVYADPGYDEARFARAVVARYGCAARETAPRPGPGLVDLLDRIGWFHDEPCARPGLVTQWHVMALAAEGHGVTVLLDGQGGDEVLLGYSYYALPYLRSLARDASRLTADWGLRMKFWRDAQGLLGQPSTTPGGPGSLAGHLARAALERLDRRRGRRPGLDPALLRAAAEVPDASPTPTAAERRGIDRLLLDDLTRRSIPALLHHEDRASMAFSLEARVPFLDHRVVELCLGLDYRQKVEGGLMKAPLRRAMRGDLPPSVVDRPDKLGYPTPLARWLREAAPAVKEALLFGFSERGYVPARHVERAWAEVEAGRGDPWRIYRWLTTELWLHRMIDHPPVASPPGGPRSRPPQVGHDPRQRRERERVEDLAGADAPLDLG